MTKKGNLILNTMAKVIIGLVTLLVISSIFFIGDNSLFPRLKQIVPRADKFIPRDYQSMPPTSVTKQLDRSKSTFEDVFQAFKDLAAVDLGDEEYCFAYIDGEALGQFQWDRAQKIKIVNDPKENTISFHLLGLFEDADKGELAKGKLWSPAYPPITVEEAQFCMVAGGNKNSGQAYNFYNNWLIEDAPGTPSSNQYRYPKGNQIVTYAWDIYEGEDWKTESDELEWENRRGADFVIYLHIDNGQRNICIFPTQDGLTTCEPRSKGFLDDDCFVPYGSGNIEQNPIYKVIDDNNYLLWSDKDQTCIGG